MTVFEELSEADVLRSISDLLTRPRFSSALAHYPTLRIQTAKLRIAFKAAIATSEWITAEWIRRASCDASVTSDFRPSEGALFSYRIIAPALVQNLHRTTEFLFDETHPAPAVGTDQIGETTPSFSDFVRLGAAARVFLDAIVQTAFQLVSFDGRQLNYKFLHSLQGFAPVAPPSLHSSVYSASIQKALTKFISMTSAEIKSSDFVTRSNEQFGQRLKVSATHVGLSEQRQQNIELLFAFCSDFVHSGYVSTFALGETGAGVIMGGPYDAFTPHAENFAELKQRLLSECVGAYSDLLIPAMVSALNRMLALEAEHAWISALKGAQSEIGVVRALLNRELIEPLRKGLTGSKATIAIKCVCGNRLNWQSPHHEWDAFCNDCGSRFRPFLVDEDVDYVISPTGIGEVNGSDAPIISQLSHPLREKLDWIADRHKPKPQNGGVPFVLVRDLARCEEDTLSVPAMVVSSPSQEVGNCDLFAFVAVKSLERCRLVRIDCNCGQSVEYDTSSKSNACRCTACERLIGLLGISGGGHQVAIQNPDGTPGTAPIQARNRFNEL